MLCLRTLRNVFVESEEDESPSVDENGSSPGSDTSGGKNQSVSNQLEQIIQRLPTCVNRDFIDDVSITFQWLKSY